MNIKEIVSEIITTPRFQEGSAWKRIDCMPGDIIVRKGDLGKTLFLIKSGTVRVLGDTDVDGKKKLSHGLCDLSEGSVFGDICLFGMRKRTASVTAIDEVSLIELDSEILRVYLDDHPVMGYLFLKSLFQVMTNRLELANERIENLLAWGLKVHDIDKYL